MMNDVLEFWSLPWHTLQRSLANGFGAEASEVTTPGSTFHGAATPGASGTWLARARGGLRHPYQGQR
jgi:hypothetical protein